MVIVPPNATVVITEITVGMPMPDIDLVVLHVSGNIVTPRIGFMEETPFYHQQTVDRPQVQEFIDAVRAMITLHPPANGGA